MSSIFKNNKVYFICFAIFLIFGGLGLILQEQGDLILFFSDNRSDFGNAFFKYFTRLGEPSVYLFLIVLFLFIRFRVSILIPILGIFITIIAFSLKEFFLHPRPSIYFKNLNQLDSINLVEGVQLLSGLTSFPSGHAMSGFGLFTFVALFANRKRKLAITLFTIALMVALSRVYLVQHFLKDIYLGAFLGVLIAILTYQLQERVFPSQSWLDKKIPLPAKPKKNKSENV